MTVKRPVAYVRRSSPNERDGGGEASRATQEQAIRDLAHRYGFNGDLEWFVDWGRSADESKLARRGEYLRLLRAVEAGEVSHVFAYALDRLNRSLILSARFASACEANGVIVVTQREGEVRQDSPDEWLRWTILATFAGYELKVMKSRAKANMAHRRERGDHIGVAPYGFTIDKRTHQLVPVASEDVSAVVEAYQRAGSFLAAAKLLTTDPDLARRAPARNGDFWSDNTVARILRREGVVSQRRERGVARSRADGAAAGFALYRLLVCPHCGRRLTAQRSKSGNGKLFARYFCSVGRRDPNHPRPYTVSESTVLPWLRPQVEGLRGPKGRKAIGGGDVEATRADLNDKVRRAGKAFADGALAEDDYDAIVADAKALLADLPESDTPLWIVTRSGRLVDFDADPSAVAEALRRLVEAVHFDADMRPTRIDWRAAVA